MTLRVGCVEYINALPLHLAFRLGKVECDAEFIYDIPTKLNALLRQGQVDVALTSSVEYLDGGYQMLADFGIVSRKKVLSVNLYTQLPLSSLSGMRVGLTSHSATSVSLLKTLCRHLWKITPRFEPFNHEEPFSNYAALLLIGNEALIHLNIPHFQTIDLGAAWYELTGLPFVFALFAYRQTACLEKMAAFKNALDKALIWSNKHRSLIEQEALRLCALPSELVHQYYHGLHYRIGKKEIESLQTFQRLSLN